MNITQTIGARITCMPEGATFGYEDFAVPREAYGAAAKAMERLIKKGTVQRVSTGVFYKPKKTAFGTLRPKEEELLKPYLFERAKRAAYVTGIFL